MRYLVAILLCLGAATANAQRAEPAGVQRTVPAQAVNPWGSPPPVYAFPARLVLGSAASFGGAMAGAIAGANLGHSCWECSNGNMDGFIIGALVGSVVSASVLASAPALGSTCTFAQRVGVALLGSVVGAGIGGVVGNAVAQPSGGVIFGTVGGSGIGSAVGAALCRKSL